MVSVSDPKMSVYIYIYIMCIYILYMILHIYIILYIYVFSGTPQVINTWNDKMICNQGLSFNPPCSVPSVIPAKCRLAFSIFQQCKSERTAAARISCVFSPGPQDSFQRYPCCHNFSLQRNYPIILPQDCSTIYTHIHIGYTYIHTHRIHIWYAFGVRKYTVYIYTHTYTVYSSKSSSPESKGHWKTPQSAGPHSASAQACCPCCGANPVNPVA